MILSRVHFLHRYGRFHGLRGAKTESSKAVETRRINTADARQVCFCESGSFANCNGIQWDVVGSEINPLGYVYLRHRILKWNTAYSKTLEENTWRNRSYYTIQKFKYIFKNICVWNTQTCVFMILSYRLNFDLRMPESFQQLRLKIINVIQYIQNYNTYIHTNHNNILKSVKLTGSIPSHTYKYL